MTEVLLTKIATVRRKEQSLGVGMALTLGTAYLVIALAVGMLVDWLIELPFIVRALLLTADLSVLAWLATTLAIRLFIHPTDDETLALTVERDEPRFEGRLISSVQLSQDGALPVGTSALLVRAMLKQTIAIAEEVDFAAAIKAELLARRAMIAIAIVLVGGGLFVTFASASVPLLERAFLMPVPVPRMTQVVAVSKDKVIAAGDNFTIEAIAKGVKPASGKATLRYASGATQEIVLNRVGQTHDDFAATVNNIQEPLTYTVYLGDNHGDPYTVTTTPRPSVTSLKCWQVFPAYTHLAPQARMPGDLGKLLRGSRLILSIGASKPLKMTLPSEVPCNRVHLAGADVPDAPLNVNPSNDLTHDHQPASAASDVDGISLPDKTNGLSIFLVDQNGIESKDPAVYPISLIDKNKPIIKLLSPKDSEVLALPSDTIFLSYTAHDDFALGGVSLHYKIEGDAKEYTVPLPLDGTPADVNGTFSWTVASLQPNLTGDAKLEGTVCECWLRAVDTDDVSNADQQPNVGDSDHFQLRVATQDEIDAHLHDLQHNAIGAIGTMTQEQQQTNDDFAHNVLQNPATTQPASGR